MPIVTMCAKWLTRVKSHIPIVPKSTVFLSKRYSFQIVMTAKVAATTTESSDGDDSCIHCIRNENNDATTIANGMVSMKLDDNDTTIQLLEAE